MSRVGLPPTILVEENFHFLVQVIISFLHDTRELIFIKYLSWLSMVVVVVVVQLKSVCTLLTTSPYNDILFSKSHCLKCGIRKYSRMHWHNNATNQVNMLSVNYAALTNLVSKSAAARCAFSYFTFFSISAKWSFSNIASSFFNLLTFSSTGSAEDDDCIIKSRVLKCSR